MEGAVTGMVAGAIVFTPLGALIRGLGPLVGPERIFQGAADSVWVGGDTHGPP